MDATFWATVALFIFIGVAVYFGAPALITKALDDRSEKIRSDLDEARTLREEAQTLLAKYQRQRKDAESEAEEIVAAARREAELLSVEAERKTEEYVSRRTAMAEQKIAQAEGQAVAEVKAAAVDLAVEAARSIIAEKVGTNSTELFDRSLSDVKARMN